MTNSSSCTPPAKQSHSDSKSKVWMANKVLHFNKKTDCGSSAPSCQANVIQTVNGMEVVMGKREIPHCITTLLSKLYYLGHSLIYDCQSYHEKKENLKQSIFGFACTHALTHRHTEKAEWCECNQHTNKQWAVINCRLTHQRILFQTE